MAIHFVSGKPGGGKTLWAVNELVRELTTGTRTIVTNITLDLDVLQFYCEEKGFNVFVPARVFLLDEEQTRKFYLHRGELVLPDPPLPEKGEEDQMPNYAPSIEHPVAGKGVVYFIDEIHLFFNSREWQKTGKRAIYYLSQHRKLNDEVWCVTQSINNVDKQFRSLAQDFSYVRNLRMSRFGLFRVGDGFKRKVYEMPVSTGNEIPFQVEDYQLDTKGIAACYRTAGGVGLPGSNAADSGKKQKGIPLKYMWGGLAAAIACMICAAIYVPGMLARAGGKMFAGAMPAAVKDLSKKPVTAISSPSAAVSNEGLKVHGLMGMDGAEFVAVTFPNGRSKWLKVIGNLDRNTLVLEGNVLLPASDYLAFKS